MSLDTLESSTSFQEVTLCREAHQGDIIEDTDTSPGSDSLLDSDQLAAADSAGEQFDLGQQHGCHECSFAGNAFSQAGCKCLPLCGIHQFLLPASGSKLNRCHDSVQPPMWSQCLRCADAVGVLELPMMPTGSDGSTILSDVDVKGHSSYHIRCDASLLSVQWPLHKLFCSST